MCPGPQTRCCPQPCSPSGRAVGQWLVDEVREEFSLQRIKPCSDLLRLCQAQEQQHLPLLSGEGEKVLWRSQSAEHSLVLPEVSLCQLCQPGPWRALPGAGGASTSQPARGCSSSNPLVP